MRPLHFRWRYIALPLVILVVSVTMAAIFYARLPADLAYHFTDGSPDRWMPGALFLAWMLVPQFLLAALAAGIVLGVIRLAGPRQSRPGAERILGVMGNMVALPQVVLSFAMANIFSYNAYGAQIMPLWLFTVIIMALSGIVLGIFFLLALKQTLVKR
jgi:uncharacterized membrane protein